MPAVYQPAITALEATGLPIRQQFLLITYAQAARRGTEELRRDSLSEFQRARLAVIDAILPVLGTTAPDTGEPIRSQQGGSVP
ncbi:hypothetical protein AQF52_0156 [Streptomyces venezuelae]|nr:hypothetical protein AQF52_0156 [Streptomyces venezuelae]